MALAYLRYNELSTASRKMHLAVLTEWTQHKIKWHSFTPAEHIRFETLELATKVQNEVFRHFLDNTVVFMVGVLTGTASFKVTVTMLRRGFAGQLLARSHRVLISPFPDSLCKYILNGGPPSTGYSQQVYTPPFDKRASIAAYTAPGFSDRSYAAQLQRTVALNEGVTHAARAACDAGKHLSADQFPPIVVVYSGAICSQLWPRYRKAPPRNVLIQRQPERTQRGLFKLSADFRSVYYSAPEADQIIQKWHFGCPTFATSFFYYPPLSHGILSDFEVTPGKISRIVGGNIADKAPLTSPFLSEENKKVITDFIECHT